MNEIDTEEEVDQLDPEFTPTPVPTSFTDDSADVGAMLGNTPTDEERSAGQTVDRGEDDEDGEGEVDEPTGSDGEIREDEGKARERVEAGSVEVKPKGIRPMPKRKTVPTAVGLSEDNDVVMTVERTMAARKRKKSATEVTSAEGREIDGETAAKKTRTRGKKKATAVEDKDVVMMDSTNSSEEDFATPDTLTKPKIGPPPRRAKATRSGKEGDTSGKRAEVGKFAGVEVSKKRTVNAKGKRKATGIDLSKYVFDENTDVDPGLVPLVRGAVCKLPFRTWRFTQWLL